MKKLRSLFSGVFAVCILSCSLLLPDITLFLMDRRNIKAETQNLAPITLELTKELSIYEKMSLACQSDFTTRTSAKEVVSDRDAVLKAAGSFLNDSLFNIHSKPIFDTENEENWFDVCPYLFFEPETGKNAVFWEVQAELEKAYLVYFIIDDQSLSILSFELNIIADKFGIIADDYIPIEMELFAESIRTRLSEQFGGQWSHAKMIGWDFTEEQEGSFSILEDNFPSIYDGSFFYYYQSYVLEVLSNETTYQFFMEYTATELHFGNLSFEKIEESMKIENSEKMIQY